MKAINLDQVIRFFSPRTPLSGQNLLFWFVERPDSPRGVLRAALRNAQQDHQPIKLLLVGHRGSGKSTEINKLLSELDGRYVPITVDIAVVTGRTVLSYVDLMLALATNITRYCINQKLVGQQPGDLLKEKWRQFGDWWRNRIAGLELNSAGDISTFASLSTLLGEIEVGAQVRPLAATN